MEIVETLNNTLLPKDCLQDNACLMDIEMYKNIALSYSQTENSVAVLSDMQFNKSYVFSSKTASELGLNFKDNPAVVDSIWEEEILNKIHSEDKLKKYVHELRFFKFLEDVVFEERSFYNVLSKIRMKDKDEKFRWVQHRMFYFYSPYNLRLRFALCLYNLSLDSAQNPVSEFLIINSALGEVIINDRINYKNVLSAREMEILKYIGDGCTSKEIAEILSISINTVSRHRQNILEKLKVKNSVKAFSESFSK